MSILLLLLLLLLAASTNGFLYGNSNQHLEGGLKLLRSLFKEQRQHQRQHRQPSQQDRRGVGRGVNGGVPCAACTILLSLAEQLTQLHNETAEESLQRMCTFLPRKYQSACRLLIEALSPLIALEILAHTSPDTICYK